MKLTNTSSVPVYTISGDSTARPLPEWLARRRKRSLKQDPEYANRVELLQDFEFEEASTCIRASEDGDWVVSTGIYKPQMHVHYLPHLSLSYSRHTNTLNQTFQLLSTDYSKSLHLQDDRSLEFHTPGGCHYTTRLPRYGRDLKYDKRSAEALVPAVGVDADGQGEVFRLNLDVGRYMRSYAVDVGGDDFTSAGGGALQGGIRTGAVNTAAIAENSHNLLAFGTSVGTVEFWDPRARTAVGILPPPISASNFESRPEVTCLQFHPSGLTLASGLSNGLIHLYDLRSPSPILKKDHGYGYPIHTLTFLTPSTSSSRTAHLSSAPKILSSDKRIIKLWDAPTGRPWTSAEPVVDLNCVTWCPDSGMILTANEGRQQHSFLIPQLGPAPRWCAFLDNLVEEMAEGPDDPAAYTGPGAGAKTGEIYDNYKFLTVPQLRSLNLDHLIGTTGLLRPYMHGYFVAQQLYEQARLISNPEAWAEQRAQSIREKIDKERESRIRGSKKVAAVKVNKRLAERLIEREERNEKRKAKRAMDKADALRDQSASDPTAAAANGDAGEDGQIPATEKDEEEKRETALTDPRFAALFRNENFAVDEDSHEFRALNASSAPLPSQRTEPTSVRDTASRLTAAELEALSEDDDDRARRRRDSLDDLNATSDSDDDTGSDGITPARRRGDRSDAAANHDKSNGTTSGSRIEAASYKRDKRGKPMRARPDKEKKEPRMHVSSSIARGRGEGGGRERTFGARMASGEGEGGMMRRESGGGKGEVSEKAVTFTVGEKGGKSGGDGGGFSSRKEEGQVGERNGEDEGRRRKDRRSASNNVFRRM